MFPSVFELSPDFKLDLNQSWIDFRKLVSSSREYLIIKPVKVILSALAGAENTKANLLWLAFREAKNE